MPRNPNEYLGVCSLPSALCVVLDVIPPGAKNGNWKTLIYTHSIHVWYLYTYMWVDFYGKLVGKYTSPMDPSWDMIWHGFQYCFCCELYRFAWFSVKSNNLDDGNSEIYLHSNANLEGTSLKYNTQKTRPCEIPHVHILSPYLWGLSKIVGVSPNDHWLDTPQKIIQSTINIY